MNTDHIFLDSMPPAGSSASVCGPGAEFAKGDRNYREKRPQSARSPPRKRLIPLANSLGYGNRHTNYYAYTGQQWERPVDPTAPVSYNSMARPYAYSLARESFSRYDNNGWERPAKGASVHPTARPQPPSLPDGWFKTQAAAQYSVQAQAPAAAPAPTPPPAPASGPMATLYSASYGTGIPPNRATQFYAHRSQPEPQAKQSQQAQVQSAAPAATARRGRVGFTPWLGRATPPASTNYSTPSLYNSHMPKQPRPHSAFVRSSIHDTTGSIFY